MRKHYAELCLATMYGSIVVAVRSYGIREKPRAITSRYGKYGRIAIAIPFWLKHTLPVQCATPVTRPASFNS